jgi:hypothetical protein
VTFSDLQEPVVPPECTPEQILTGPRLEPKEYVRLYSDKKFEAFIEEWAFYYLKQICSEYVRVVNFSGSGDRGRDVIGYVDETQSPPLCDVFQCKHYKNPVTASEFMPELAKLCKHSCDKTIPIPRQYWIVAPQDVGPGLGELLETPEDVLEALKKSWKDTSKKPLLKIGGKAVALNGVLEKFVDAFDFSIVKPKPILEIISEFEQTNRYAQRFGGGLAKPLPPTSTPPHFGAIETRYVEQLVAVYSYDSGDPTIGAAQLLGNSSSTVARHFNRSRERFYFAETIREFARDNLPDGFEYQTIQTEVYDGVIDTVEADYDKALDRVNATTDTASGLSIGEHPLKPYLKTQSLKGICHQLVNDDQLTWISGDADD